MQITLSPGFHLLPSNTEGETATSFKDLIEIETLETILEPFWQSTGLGIALFDENLQLVASVGWQKICTHFHMKHPESYKSCIESQNYFRKNFNPGVILSFKCSNGLWDIAYPVYHNSTFIGYIGFGQFFVNDDEIEKEFFVQQAQKYNFDTDEYINHLRSIPIFTKQKLESHINLFLNIVKLNIDKQ